MNQDLDEDIRGALQQVCDPCSIAANAPLSILDMGLIRGWSIDPNGNLLVRMGLTSASCTMSPHMVKAAQELLAAVPGITSARVEVDPEFFWTPDHMTERGRELLQARREASRVNTEVMPQQWRSRGNEDDV
jgi:metal-sulfur cluster biosynthetic enzyme